MKLSVAILVATALFVAGVAQARHSHAQTVTLFGASIPKTPIDPDTSSVTLGVQFHSTQAGTIKGVRFYRASRSTSGYQVGIFDVASGSRLAFASVASEPCASVPCWEELDFSAPLSISANKTYISAYFVKGGHYAGDTNGLANTVTSGPLVAPGSASISGGNGVYNYGTSLMRPNSTYQASNYYVDVSFTPAAPPPPNLVLNFNPANPAIPDSSPLGTVVATANADWSDDINGSHPFTGTLGFTTPYQNDAGTFGLSGNSLVIASGGPGVGQDGGTTQNVTVIASQSTSSVTKNLAIQVTRTAVQTPLSVSFSPAGPVSVNDNAAAGTVLSAVQVATSDGNPYAGTVAISAQSAAGMTSLSSGTLPSNVDVASINSADDGPQTVSVQACENGTCTSPAILSINVNPPSTGVALLPPDRDASANWKKAGLTSVGGIPNRTTVCATLNPSGGDDVGPIASASAACPAGQVVMLGAGTFNMNSNVANISNSITLRGSGPGVTKLTATNGAKVGVNSQGSHPNAIVQIGGSGNKAATTTLQADAVQGSYSVQVTSAAGFTVGGFAHIDELGLGQPMVAPELPSTERVWAEPDYRVEWNAHSPSEPADSATYDNNFTNNPNGDACAYSIRCGGVNSEIHQITAISGNTLTFDSPLTLPYKTARSAQVYAYSAAPSGLAKNIGVENLSMQGGGTGDLFLFHCAYCWAKNVESSVWINAGGIGDYHGFRNQLEGNWVHNAAWPVNGGGGYAINLTFGTSESLIQNNIVMLANKVIVMRASGAGVVVGYNYMDDGYIDGNATWVETGLNCSHLVGSHHALFEGNQSFNVDSDYTHGNATYCTYFRNWATGFRAPFTQVSGTHVDDSTGCCSPQRGLSSHPYTYWTSFIGNVVGTPGKMGGWALNNNSIFGFPAVYAFGWNDLFSNSGNPQPDPIAGVIYPAVPNSACTSSGTNCATIQDGNYDYLSNSIQWASNDSAHTLPASFYLTSKPAFFTGSASTWPWVVPNGTPQLYTLPAKARWDAGTPFTQP